MSKAPLRRLKKEEIIWLAETRCKHGHGYLHHYNCYLSEVDREAEKVGFLDIEASDLVAEFGTMFSYCIKARGGEILEGCLRPRDFASGDYDKHLVAKCIEDMRKFDRLVTYWGVNYRYDIPMVRSRALFHGLDFPHYGEIIATDVYDWVKSRLKLRRNRMQNACEFLDIPSKFHPLKGPVWLKALSGKQEALDYIMEHNREDVVSLELLYERLLPYVRLGRGSV